MIPHIFNLLSLMGTFVFAVSGALFAAEKRMDILGLILIAAVTGIGGGTLRDLLLGITPVFWVREPINITLVIMAAVISYMLLPQLRQRDQWILWMDAIGLAVFAVLGAQAALLHESPPIVAVVMGVMTATFGGIIRDVLCAEVLTLMSPELYISCALMGALSFVLLAELGLDYQLSALAAFFAGVMLRGAAIMFKITLPRVS